MINNSKTLEFYIVFISALFCSSPIYAQHTIYPDLIIWGSDSLVEGSTGREDTSIIFDLAKGGISGGTKDDFLYTWYRDSIGPYSFAFGFNAMASGNGSAAFGYKTTASGDDGATTFGYLTDATGHGGATALGYITNAEGDRGATSLGYQTDARGNYGSTAIGAGSNSKGDNGATAIGYNTGAFGDFGSTGIGDFARSYADHGAIALGYNTSIHANSGTVVGQYNDTLVTVGYDEPDKPMFQVGNGTGYADRSNAMVVRQNGLTTIQKDLIVGRDSMPGDGVTEDQFFFFNKNKYALRSGLVNGALGSPWAPDSIGLGSVAFGLNAQADGFGAMSFGAGTAAFGDDGSSALGYFTIANADRGTALGQFNDPLVFRGYNGADKPLFIVGNGTSASDRANAMVVRQNGKIGIGDNDPNGYLHIKKAGSVSNPLLEIEETVANQFTRLRFRNTDNQWTIGTKTSGGESQMVFNLNNSKTHTLVLEDAQLSLNGKAYKTTAGDWLASSDRRIKTNITEINNSYELLNQLRPVKFKYSEEWKLRNPSIKDQYYYNFIAQEYQEVFPEAVQGSGQYLENDAEEILQIDTYNAQIVTIAAVKELIKQNEQLKSDNELLHKKLQDLETMLEQIRNQITETNSSE